MIAFGENGKEWVWFCEIFRSAVERSSWIVVDNKDVVMIRCTIWEIIDSFCWPGF